MENPEIRNQIDLSKCTKDELFAAIADSIRSGKSLVGKGGLFTSLMKQALEAALEGELDAHLDNAVEEGNNRKNGKNSKTVKSSSGAFELEVPRDRNSSFEPQIVKKRQTVLTEELDNKVLALYGLGNSYDAISGHLQDIYGVEVPPNNNG